MVAKRKRRASPSSKGLAPGEIMHRDRLAGSNFSAWGWVGSEVSDACHITREHILATCGFSNQSEFSLCTNSYQLVAANPVSQRQYDPSVVSEKESESDVIIVSDDPPVCNKKVCRKNPNCLNYLGQDVWEDEDDAKDLFLRASKLGENPILDAREPNLPVGLKNLGATCYANAFLQVWFRDLAFRKGVYQCRASEGQDDLFEKSPVFQLQATFAALQESTQSVFNPTKLVESLRLRTAEQQDAQEFSKLFMSHLDAEFQKQTDPSLKTLITDQFQGQQVYGTICDRSGCGYRSECVSDFLEIEITFGSDSRLEDCLSALLQPEKLSGENKYSCPRCESLQDATRYTEFRRLPPVLHFSLLRFIYDFSSMERKKSKHALSFPTSIDMGRFLCGASNSGDAPSERNPATDIYELRGVLLHKGLSAYHGHYEAQVFDTLDNTWFQFNDESVSQIETPSDKKGNSALEVMSDNSRKKSGLHDRQRRPPVRKKRRIDDSDDDRTNVAPLDNTTSWHVPSNRSRVSSKDAYMLIYSRQREKADRGSPSKPQIPVPPAPALDVVKQLNAAHDEACEKFEERQKLALQRFQEVRQNVMDIYRCWNISSVSETSIVVSRDALECWLSMQSVVSALQTEESCTLRNAASETENGCLGNGHVELRDETQSSNHLKTIDVEHILCPHGKLDPRKASDMKRITQAAIDMISARTNFIFRPVLTTEDVCTDCVKMIFTERLYQIEHPRLVNQFDQLCDDSQDDDHPGYWISKRWLKDWRLVKPKMHCPSRMDPSPDEDEYALDVSCEHGELSLNTTSRRRIPAKACEVITGLYPSWNPSRADTEPCPICESLIYVSKEDKREIRKMAEEEKAKLKHMNEASLNASTILENVPCAIVPTQFIRTWRNWLLRPTEKPRPDMIDNTPFLCGHDKLIFDPNDPTDLDSSISVIKRTEWDYLEVLYSGGPLIALEKCVTEENIFGVFIHEIPVCADCRLKRKLDWDITDITLRILGAKDALTRPDGLLETQPPLDNRPTLLAGHEPGKSVRLRQSKRLRQVKQGGDRRKLTVSKGSTIKEIKIDIQNMLGIPTICQRLFHRERELEDNEVTLASLGVLVDDTIDLREENEDTLAMSDTEVPAEKKRRDEERGFGGTLLGQLTPVHRSSSPLSSPPGSDDKPCTACTFHNPLDAELCDMCQTPFL